MHCIVKLETVSCTYRCCLKAQPTNGVHGSAPVWRQGQDNVLAASCGIVIVSADAPAAAAVAVVWRCTCIGKGNGIG